MAEVITKQIVDDLTGETLEADEVQRVEFSIDGRHYRLDVSKDGADEFHEALSKYRKAATYIPGNQGNTGTRTRRQSSTPRRDDLAEVREWANSNGFQVSDRGRVPAEVLDAYDNRNAKPEAPKAPESKDGKAEAPKPAKSETPKPEAKDAPRAKADAKADDKAASPAFSAKG